MWNRGVTFHVRLQPDARQITSRERRRQTSNDEFRHRHPRVRCSERPGYGGMRLAGHRARFQFGNRGLWRLRSDPIQDGNLSPNESRAAAYAPRCARITGRTDAAPDILVRRARGNRVAIAGTADDQGRGVGPRTRCGRRLTRVTGAWRMAGPRATSTPWRARHTSRCLATLCAALPRREKHRVDRARDPAGAAVSRNFAPWS